jgi:hypothetical protein
MYEWIWIVVTCKYLDDWTEPTGWTVREISLNPSVEHVTQLGPQRERTGIAAAAKRKLEEKQKLENGFCKWRKASDRHQLIRLALEKNGHYLVDTRTTGTRTSLLDLIRRKREEATGCVWKI